MTRSTAQVMEWYDPIQVARIEAYCTGYYAALEQSRPAARTTSDYEAGYDAGLRFLALGASPSHSLTQPR